MHSGHDNDGLLTENATPASPIPLPAKFDLGPGVFGGIESQLATNGSTTFAAVNNLAVPLSVKGVTESSKAFEASIGKATGEMIAVNPNPGMPGELAMFPANWPCVVWSREKSHHAIQVPGGRPAPIMGGWLCGRVPGMLSAWIRAAHADHEQDH